MALTGEYNENTDYGSKDKECVGGHVRRHDPLRFDMSNTSQYKKTDLINGDGTHKTSVDTHEKDDGPWPPKNVNV